MNIDKPHVSCPQALMSIFFWHIVPLVWVKLGPVIAAVVIAIMLSAWLGLVIWVPNVVINLVRSCLLAMGINCVLVVPLLHTACRQVTHFLCVCVLHAGTFGSLREPLV